MPPVTSTVIPGASASAAAISSPLVTTTSSRLAQLEREVVRGRARVERNGLTLLDERRGCPRDRLLALGLEPQAQIESELRLASLKRPHTTSETGDKALARKFREITSHRDLGNRKHFRKFRNMNGITVLEHPQDLLHTVAL